MTHITLTSADRKELKDAINEMSNALLRIDSEREVLKETAADISKKFGIKKSIVNKVAKALHTHKYNEIQMENDHFEYVYESLMGRDED